VPEPLRLFLASYGTFTSSLGEEIKANFPSYPETEINNFGGYYPVANAAVPINADNHNLYEEIPAPGLYAELLRIASDPKNRNANLNPTCNLSTPESIVNRNCLGYDAIPQLRSKQLKVYVALGIDTANFRVNVLQSRHHQLRLRHSR
jgi:hypothetical protein